MSETFFGITVWDVQGHPALSQVEMRDVTRPNVDGIAFGSLGTRGQPTPVFVIAMFANKAAADAFEVSINQQVGNVSSFTQAGSTYSNYILKRAIRTGLQRHALGRGGAPAAASAWTVRYTCTVQYKL